MRLTSFTPKQMAVMRQVAQEQNEKMKGTRSWRIFDTVMFLLFAVTVVLAIHTFIFEPIRVEGTSMYPTLLNKEHMAVEKVTYLFNEPKRGDILICYYPGYTKSCVKRLIGLPGDTVKIYAGQVFVNGEELDESEYWTDIIERSTDEVTVPNNCYFVMGDNRNYSKDSRNNSVGCIPRYRIVGRVFGVMWPFSKIRLISGAEY